MKIIRIGLEKPVAEYSICGARPRNPQSHVGPIRTRDFRASTSHITRGMDNRHKPAKAIPSVETVPAPALTVPSTHPLAVVKFELIC